MATQHNRVAGTIALVAFSGAAAALAVAVHRTIWMDALYWATTPLLGVAWIAATLAQPKRKPVGGAHAHHRRPKHGS